MKKKALLIGGLVAAALLWGVYTFVFNAQHRNIAKEDATVTLSADALFTAFITDEATATKRYLDKVIALSGVVSTIENENDAVLNGKIQVRFSTTSGVPLVNQKAVTVKGRCVGYDELLELVKIDQATLIHN
jgi:hypothetical protein